MVIAKNEPDADAIVIKAGGIGSVGRAYLGHCPDKERETNQRRLLKSDKVVDRRAREPKRLDPGGDPAT